MSVEVYLGCERCKCAYHVGYIVTVRSNFVFDRDIADRLRELEKWIDEHSYCGGEISCPRMLWENGFDEDEWTVLPRDDERKPTVQPEGGI
jgi:hypothetical protein